MFSHLTIIDLSTVLAGPSVGTFFAELGAQVIKIENPKIGGDVTRSWKLANEPADAPLGAYFASVNCKKTYLYRDLSIEKEKEEILQLLSTADIVLSNFKKGDAEKFGLTDDALHHINPRLIHGKISGFSSTPERVAYDVVLQAETGFMYMNGTPESGPVKMPVALIDVIAAHQLKEGLLCALYERERSGKVNHVHCSLEKAGLSALVNQASNYLMADYVPQPLGSLHPNIAPYGEIVHTHDQKQIVLAVGSDKQFRSLCSILQIASLADDERFAHNKARIAHRVELLRLLNEAFGKKDRSDWMPLLIEANIPAGAIYAMNEVMESPTAQSMIVSENIQGVETQRISSVAFDLSSPTTEQEF
ncbi:MAG: hypothetical protein RLZZ77_1016 [Bacteroidota bacterium]|jgi:crotonobetainyl-CoA:carnitine CoA-transferase CaiB-like acyl-CoA transferase